MTEPTQSGISRRTLAKGAAWSVPAVAVAAAAPAYALSGRPPGILPGVAYKLPGNSCNGKGDVPTGLDPNKGYMFTFQVTNNTDEDIYIYPADSTITTTSAGLTFDVVDIYPPASEPIEPDDTITIALFANGSSSANTSFNVTAKIAWGHSAPDADGKGTDLDAHDPVSITFRVCATPTLASQGLAACKIPPYQSPSAACVTTTTTTVAPAARQASTETTTVAEVQAKQQASTETTTVAEVQAKQQASTDTTTVATETTTVTEATPAASPEPSAEN